MSLNKIDLIKNFLDSNSNIDLAYDNYDLLHFAVKQNALPIVKLLVNKGVNINALTISQIHH